MRTIFFLITVLMIGFGCDAISVRYDIGNCMEHMWISGTYKVMKKDGFDIQFQNVSGGDDRVVSKLDHGWKKVRCPKF